MFTTERGAVYRSGKKKLHWYQVMLGYKTFILMKEICLFMPSGLNGLTLCIQNFSLLFLSNEDYGQ